MSRKVWNVLKTLRIPPADANFAFVILNQPILCEPELVSSMWKKACLRWIVDGGSNRWLDFIQRDNDPDKYELPDFISGDFDSIKPNTKSHFMSKGVKMISTPDQDETDFMKALKCIKETADERKLKVECIIVLCENSGRLDQIIANMSILHRAKYILSDVPVLLLSRESVTWVLPPGSHTISVTEDFVNKHYICGLLPLCGPTIVTTSGLQWNLNNQILAMDGLVSSSNSFSEKEVEITCNLDLVWTMEHSKLSS